MHTTCALLVNEYQHALIDGKRGNAHAHLRTALLGRSVALGVNDGELMLGRFQSVIFAEVDGPRARSITVQVVGE